MDLLNSHFLFETKKENDEFSPISNILKIEDHLQTLVKSDNVNRYNYCFFYFF